MLHTNVETHGGKNSVNAVDFELCVCAYLAVNTKAQNTRIVITVSKIKVFRGLSASHDLPVIAVVSREVIVAAASAVRELCHLAELVPGEAEHGVAGLVVELIRARRVLGVPRDAVILSDADAAAEEVARGGARVHGELAGVDDGETAVGGELWALGEAFLAIDAVSEVVGLLWQHGLQKFMELG